jgi:uncharacterized Fe-S cluster-containing radical SAM superfamily protein
LSSFPFELIDPESRAEEIRPYMINTAGPKRRYFVANLEESSQEGEVFGGFFRPRDYMKKREGSSRSIEEWLKAAPSEVWSPKFLGLDECGIQKLEFQNPAYVAAYRLGGDPRDYNRVFAIQLNGCAYECSYCFVPRELNKPELGKGKLFSAEEMLQNFLKAREHYSKRDHTPLSVVRLTGGEVTSIVPEAIVDVHKEMQRGGLLDTVYLWVDCNLSTTKYVRLVETDLKEIAKHRNFGMVGCLKAVGDGESGKEDFTIVTRARPEDFKKQFEALDYFVNEIEADFFVYLVPFVSGERSDVMERLTLCADRLREIDPNLPLRTNILQIKHYGPAVENVSLARKEGRPLPWYDERTVFETWYYDVLPKFYSQEEMQRYRCQVQLREGCSAGDATDVL